MTVTELLTQLARTGGQVSVEGEELRIRAPKGALPPDLLREWAARKVEILAALRSGGERLQSPDDAIPRTARDRPMPLSDVQRELWLAEQFRTGALTRQLTAAFALEGELNLDFLQKSAEAVARRHESLRTTFSVENDEPVQVIHATPFSDLPLADLSSVAPEEQTSRWRACLTELASRRFDLHRGPLFHTSLVRLAPLRHVLHLAAHHIVFDVESVWIYLRELAQAYGAFVQGQSLPFADLPIQYADFAAWQRSRSPDGIKSADRDIAYWRRQLRDAPGILELPPDRPRELGGNFGCSRSNLPLPSRLVEGLRALSRKEGLTPFVIYLTAFAVLLSRYSGKDDILVGTPVSGRYHPETEALVGPFAYPLVLRADLSGGPSIGEVLGRVRETTLGAFEHQNVSFGKILEVTRPWRRPGFSPLFQVMFTYPPKQAPISAAGLCFRPLTGMLGASVEYDLLLSVTEGEEGVVAALTYRNDLFESGTTEAVLRDFAGFLEDVVRDPDSRLWSLSVKGMPGRALGAGKSLARPEPPRSSSGCDGIPPVPTEKGESTVLPGRTVSVLGDDNPLHFAEMEAALRKLPFIIDARVLARNVDSAGPELIAYIVSARSFSPESLGTHLQVLLPGVPLPVAFVPVSNLPLDAGGAIDGEALAGLPVIDSSLVREVEARVRALARVPRLAIVAQEAALTEPALHLSDLLPSWKAMAAPKASPLVEADRANPPSVTLDDHRPLAISSGGPLLIPRDAPQTLTEAFLRTAARDVNKGLIYVGIDGKCVRQSYASLFEEAKRILAGLEAAGFRPQDQVLLQLEELRDHFAAFWACVLGGIVPVTVAVAPSYEEKNGVVHKLYNTWRLLGRPAVLTSGRLAPAVSGLARLMPMEGLRVLSVDVLRGHGAAARIHDSRPEDRVFFQLTSGSTGMPKCIQETHRAIIAHIHGSQQFNGYSAEDVCLNWLPMDHVVPILTCHLKDVYLGCPEIQVKTPLILSHPEKWLELIEDFKVTHTWAPNFGFKLVADALRKQPPRKTDLSSVKFFMNAGEQVTMPVLRDFLAAVAPYGVKPQSMQPAFGMAEACTCMTYQNDFSLEKGFHPILKSSLTGQLREVNCEDGSTVSFVDLGPPIPGVQIRIADASNRPLPEGVIGRFQIKGDVITPGYLHNPEANRESFVGDGWFNSGDLGFILDGRLSLTGREKEIIIIRGANFYCYEFEDVVNGVEGVEPTFSAACGVPDPATGTEDLALFFVPKAGFEEDRIRLTQTIRAKVAKDLGISPAVVIPLTKSEFPKTTSGKIQRNQLKKSLEAGHFDTLLKELDIQLANKHTLPSWFYERVWRQRKIGALPESFRARSFLVFQDSCGLGRRISERLLGQGAVLAEVAAGSRFREVDDSHYEIDPRDANHYRNLLQALAGKGFRSEQILYLWPFPLNPDAAASRQSCQEPSQEETFRLLALIRALHECNPRSEGIRLLVVSADTQATSPSDKIRLEKGTLPGLLKTVPREIAWLHCRHVDLEAGALEGNAGIILQELWANDAEAEVAYRGGRRLVCRLRKGDLRAAQARPLPFKPQGTYLLSGGLGGIGVEIAKYLLQQYQFRLLILGTTPLEAGETGGSGSPDHRAERQAALRSLQQLGGEVRYAAVDICDLAQLRSTVQEMSAGWGGRWDGVIHLAGSLSEKALFEETRESFAAALRTKVAGTWALHQLVKDDRGALFVHFASVNGYFGGFRVGAYSAANSFLESFAHYQREECALESYCLAWSMWDETGMSRGYPSKELSRSRGYCLVSPQQGLQSFLVAMQQKPRDLMIGLDGSKPDVRHHLEMPPYGLTSLRAYYVPERKGDKPPEGQFQDRFGIPVACHLSPVDELPARADGTIDRDRLAAGARAPGHGGSPSHPVQSETEKQIARLWKELLNVHEPGLDENFFDLGGHSMLLLQMHTRLIRDIGREFPLLDLLRYPTIRSLAAHLSRGQAAETAAARGQTRAEIRRGSPGRDGRGPRAQRRALQDVGKDLR